MKPNLKNFKVTPSIVMADKESVITIKSLDGLFRFYDDVTYEVSIAPIDESDVPLDEEMTLLGFKKNRKVQLVKPENGVLRVKYYFSGEQEWCIHISTKEYKPHLNPLYEKVAKKAPAWNVFITAPEDGIDVYIYSLKEDLYNKKVMRGDLHIHTSGSDGRESPEYTAAAYRKAGFDFIAVTDHNVFNTSQEAEKKLEFIKNFKILRGEEVHNGYAGYFHMVNIGGNYSINEIYLNNPDRVEQEVAQLEGEIEVPENLDKKEYLHRVWLYREIKKSGGYAIYPHPYWYIGHYHTPTKMSKAIMQNGLCDAFEILGGCTSEGNNMQVLLYNELKEQGLKMPVVGSSDSHSVLSGKPYFTYASTIVFADESDIINAISKGYSVAVESVKGESNRVYGQWRLARYTQFLLNNYFPIHNEFCFASGLFMEDYVHGEEELKIMIEKTEEKLIKFNKEFFGR